MRPNIADVRQDCATSRHGGVPQPLSLQPVIQPSGRGGTARYVSRRRIERAKTLMRRTNRPLVWIAQDAKFSDQSQLHSTFLREMGVTPGRFRAPLN
jgi:AraC-like DNA-binding protein